MKRILSAGLLIGRAANRLSHSDRVICKSAVVGRTHTHSRSHTRSFSPALYWILTY